MSSRFQSHAQQRSALFGNYDRQRQQSSSPAGKAAGGGPSGYGQRSDSPYGGGYGFGSGSGLGSGMNGSSSSGGFRTATPNKKGQYSDTVMDELEKQNDDLVEGMTARVKMLKNITIAMGDDIRDSSKIADQLNESFENTRIRLKGTMNRMLIMAERSGVGWRVWLGFFALVILLFLYVWLK